MRSKFGRQAPQKTLPAGHFLLDSFSAIKEYAKHRPEMLRSIVFQRESEESLVRSLSKNPSWDIYSQTQWKENCGEILSQASLWGVVECKSKDEDLFYSEAQNSKKDVVIALDHITDPNNLGAIARNAAFFGVRNILAPKDRQVLMTPAAVATSQGAFALTELVVVGNLATSLKKLQDLGYWIIGTSMEGENCRDVVNQYEKFVLVLGSEGKGITPLIRKICDRTVSISTSSSHPINSLNVSVASGIFLHVFCGTNS